jgi:hypothetical protein
MRKLIHRYSKSKYSCFISGLLFACISFAALIFCIIAIKGKNMSGPEIILPFGIAVLSMIVGVFTMYGLERDAV